MEEESNSLSKFALNVGDIFGTLNCIRIASNLDQFIDWLKNEYKVDDFNPIFEGYKFFIESAIRTFLHTVIYESSLGIKEDFVFFRARFSGILINKVPNTCEKTIFLKHIINQLREISRAKNINDLKKALLHFKELVIDTFDRILDKNILVAEDVKILKDEALRYETIFWVYIFLNDTSSGLLDQIQIPKGYWISILNNSINKERYSKVFHGYKYSLQFTWSNLLGEKYRSTSLINLHTSKTWSVLDSYFEKIRDEIINPIEKQLGTNLGFPNALLNLKEKIPASSLKKFLVPMSTAQLTEKECLEYNLLWYNLELLDASSIFNGVPAFIALLAGTAELKHRFSKGEDKAYVCKFTHPDKSVNGNDFSYGVLIEAFGSAGISDYSGWILFFDCCGDHSGFTGSEHAMAEAIIDEYKKRKQIELREMIIEKNKFKKYIAPKIVSRNQEDIYRPLERESRERLKTNIIAESRGLITELLAYYTLTKSGQGIVNWNIVQNKDQYDLILETVDQTILVECVYNPSNMNADDEVKKIKEKLVGLKTRKTKNCVFWFWLRPQQKTIDRLHRNGINFEVIYELIQTDPAWRGKKLDKLKIIFNFAV